MTVTVTTKALKTKLVTLADVKTAIAPGDSDDAYLNKLIDRVSRFLERECRIRFPREIVTETFNGNRRTDKALSRFPIVNLGALTYDGTTIETTEYEILDADAGIIFNENRWRENIAVDRLITVQELNFYGDKDYSLIYTAGYLLPSDNVTTGVAVTSDASAKTFTLGSGKWPLLVANDKITFGGFVGSALNVEFTVVSRTDSVVTVSETVSATEVGTAVTYTVQTLPEDIEEAAIQLVNSWFSNRSRDSNIKSERLGDWAATYGDSSSLSSFVSQVINNYKVIF